MTIELPKTTSSPLFSWAHTMREACRQSGQDDGGHHCPTCPLKYLCDNDERWLIPLLVQSQPL